MFIHRIELTGRFTAKDIHGILGKSQDRTARDLWRFDELYGKQYLLVVSELETINSSLLGDLQSKPYDEFLRRLENNQQWHFRLTANPIISRWVEVKDKVTGERKLKDTGEPELKQQRFPLTIKEQPDWLSKRAANNGFELLSTKIVRSDNIRFRKLIKSKQEMVTVLASEFEGTLRITDVEALRAAMISGIGHAKAYGCGLLTLARL
ncbi:MAG: type I-E CRISPR-associated protein Cas6/Cse3/CasE [Gracilibacteraceae bacterium]|jgi:CRISPR system Cascade subunit CasE|nr:type I-E CRISPR-associated protein Cas6/Cse3/CasE [Gracilibacteraceae bacterium]